MAYTGCNINVTRNSIFSNVPNIHISDKQLNHIIHPVYLSLIHGATELNPHKIHYFQLFSKYLANTRGVCAYTLLFEDTLYIYNLRMMRQERKSHRICDFQNSSTSDIRF